MNLVKLFSSKGLKIVAFEPKLVRPSQSRIFVLGARVVTSRSDKQKSEIKNQRAGFARCEIRFGGFN